MIKFIILFWIIPICLILFLIWLQYKISHNWNSISIEDFIDVINKEVPSTIFIWLPLFNITPIIVIIAKLIFFYIKDIKI